ncbi:DUF6907 domain-containing protein [Streptomyces rhizosphaerihabitans]|uniref:DUF6907 domain-containing protein n=1 Tax=Streptomyces rhizosphaerihabitans TaxID=1266770 RepID=UPI0021C226DA|nr:hypothetical protein [Streptomyces rhizosphaerihabitans]MCT9009994.1 hypothetical protein [Streptomyces rhizosphaerihabitans]
MSTEPRTVTLATADRGTVTIPEPAWCAGHSPHDPETEYVDIIHSGPETSLTFRSVVLLAAGLVQSPHASPSAPHLGGRTPGVSVHPVGRTLGPVDLYELAAVLDTYADALRDLGDQLDALRGGQ